MAEIQSNSNNRSKRGVQKSHKLSTRVDLTPMVDLGFLLITFFIFTTSMSQPTAMKLIMPDDSNIDVPSRAAESMTLTLVLGDNHSIYYYNGIFDGHLATANFRDDEIRSVIQQKMREVAGKFGDKRKTIVLIKVTENAAYNDIVNTLDEMLINGVSKYISI